MTKSLPRSFSCNEMLRRSVLGAAIGSALGMSSAGAIAQSAPAAGSREYEGLAEIVVTAQKREESQQSVPIAVSVLSSAALEAQGITSLADLATSPVPGLTVLPFAGSPNTLSFNARGVSAPDPAVGLADAGVAVYSDGIVIARSNGLGLELSDLERIEVLRGPQGTLFGRNAEGGAVQYISKKPTGELGGRIEGSVGNFGESRLLAHLDLPEFAGLSVKLSGLTAKHDGYVKNHAIQPGDDLAYHDNMGESDQHGGRVAVLWKPSDNFNAYYAFDITHSAYTNYYTQRTGGPTPAEPAFCQVPSFAAFCATPAGIAANIYKGTLSDEGGRPETSSVPLYIKPNTDNTQGHALTLTWDATPTVQLKSLTGWRKVSTLLDNNLGESIAFVQFVPSSLFDGNTANGEVPPGTQAAVSGSYSHALIDERQFSQEFQLIGTYQRFKYTAGLFYFNEKATDLRDSFFTLAYAYLGQPGVLTPFSVSPFSLTAPSAQGRSTSLQVYDAKATSYAAYFQGTYNPPVLDDKFELTLGLRYTHDDKEHTRTIFQGSTDGTQAPKFDKDRVDPAVIFAYHLTDSMYSYLRYATAYRAGGVWLRNKGALTTYDSEETTSYELGLKSDLFDRRLRYNVALYRNRIKNYQTSEQNAIQDPSSSDIVNLHEPVTFIGIENEVTFAPIRPLLLSVSYAYQHVSAPAEIPSLLPTLDGTNQIPFTPANSPKSIATASIDWTIPLAGLQLVPHLDYVYQSAFSLVPSVPLFTSPTPSKLSMLNARLTLQNINTGVGNLSIAAWGKNLANSNDYSYTFSAPTSDFTVTQPGGAAYVVPPRTYGLDIRYQF